MRDLFSDDPDPLVSGRADQFSLARLEVFHWGTFQGFHEIDLAPEGHLLTGNSGSGKSTLLDAHAALTTPPKWKDYNVAAAQEGEKKSGDRSDVSYVRGAWSQQTGEEGTVVAQYLRPDTTWSAVTETYRNDRGQTVVLGLVLWVRGRTTAPTDVQKRYFVSSQELSIRDLQFFPESDFDVRLFKTKAPALSLSSEFSQYGERFRNLLGIEEELALRLLHKTQSAKNLGDLNLFLRDFMLDAPDTFRFRDRLVQEFQTLREAHDAVVRARQQIEVLTLAQDARHETLDARGQRVFWGRLEDYLPDAFGRVRRSLTLGELERTRAAWAAANAQANDAERRLNELALDLRSFEAQRDGAGGAQLAEWSRELDDAEARRVRAQGRRPRFDQLCAVLDVALPRDSGAFSELRSRAQSSLDAVEQRRNQLAIEGRQRSEAQWLAGGLFQKAKEQVDQWSKRKTRIDPALQGIRDQLAAHLAVAEDELPFVGELVEVLADEAPWRGAIEKVLAGIATTLLVPHRLYVATREYLDVTHLGHRLRYETEPRWDRLTDVSASSLVRKVRIKEGVFASWVDGILRDRFDLACVEGPGDWGPFPRAVTRRGQIKWSAHRHEKNDTHPIDDPRYWLLGFDNADKVRSFQAEAQKRAEEFSAAQALVAEVEGQLADLGRRRDAWAELASLAWDDVDVGGPADRVEVCRRRIEEIRASNTVLNDLDRRLTATRLSYDETQSSHRKLVETLGRLRGREEDLVLRLATLGEISPDGDPGLDPAVVDLVGGEVADLSTEAEVAAAELLARRAVAQKKEASVRQEGEALHRMLDTFRAFLARWPEYSGDLRADEVQTSEFLDLLERLQGDGLPAYEEKFLSLLTDQSDNNLMSLSTQIDEERKAIRRRLAAVNEGLKAALFNHRLGSHLSIKVEEKRLNEVVEFRQRIADALGFSLGEDPRKAESRFLVIDRLVQDLASADPEMVRWQNLVLDVRKHVEFVARELDEAGEELNVYQSGAGKSGGQRQLLSASVLAAALRYQLGGRDKELPRFRTVVLDEAFDKADVEFTRSALTTFRRLGFQLILATPGKSLDTIQTFVGGGSLVTIRDQKRSQLATIRFESAEKLVHEES